MGELLFARRVFLAAFLGLVVAAPRASAANRDALWDIIQCLDAQAPPVQASPASPRRVCDAVVFDETRGGDSVVIEDIKMSGCRANASADEKDPRSYAYVHALALPLARVAGVEQEEGRPGDIWDLAWRTATIYIPDASDIVLTANPKAHRTQDQLHVHMTRLRPGAKDELLHPRPGSRRIPPTYVDALSGPSEPVWTAAERSADELAALLGVPPGLKTGAFGVAVVFDEARVRYAVVAVDDSPEKDYAARCPVDEKKP
jgi:hypothetical protein